MPGYFLQCNFLIRRGRKMLMNQFRNQEFVLVCSVASVYISCIFCYSIKTLSYGEYVYSLMPEGQPCNSGIHIRKLFSRIFPVKVSPLPNISDCLFICTSQLVLKDVIVYPQPGKWSNQVIFRITGLCNLIMIVYLVILP